MSYNIDAISLIEAPKTIKFPVNSLLNREFGIESGSH
jgi:hypothetical protein